MARKRRVVEDPVDLAKLFAEVTQDVQDLPTEAINRRIGQVAQSLDRARELVGILQTEMQALTFVKSVRKDQ